MGSDYFDVLLYDTPLLVARALVSPRMVEVLQPHTNYLRTVLQIDCLLDISLLTSLSLVHCRPHWTALKVFSSLKELRLVSVTRNAFHRIA